MGGPLPYFLLGLEVHDAQRNARCSWNDTMRTFPYLLRLGKTLACTSWLYLRGRQAASVPHFRLMAMCITYA